MKKAGFVCSLAVVLFTLGCGASTQLVSMSITPTAGGVIGFGDTIPTQFKVYGNFIHPTESRDITNEVVWVSSTPAVATVVNGLVTPTGTACGGTIITATAGKNLIGGGTGADSHAEMNVTATFTVYAVNTPGCPAPPTN